MYAISEKFMFIICVIIAIILAVFVKFWISNTIQSQNYPIKTGGNHIIDEHHASVPDFINNMERLSDMVVKYGGAKPKNIDDSTTTNSDDNDKSIPEYISRGKKTIHENNSYRDNINEDRLKLNNAIVKIEDLEKTKEDKKPWYEYATWDDLALDPVAVDDYYNHINYWRRMKAPIAWSELYEVIAGADIRYNYDETETYKKHINFKDRFKEVSTKEYIGVGVIMADGTIRIIKTDVSNTSVQSEQDPDICASLDNDTLQRMIKLPGSFIFHTHPIDPSCEGIMSSLDLIIHTTLIAHERYLYGIVVSRYGILIQGLEPRLLQDLYGARFFNRALKSFIFDLISSHNARKSWRPHTLKEYFDFFEQFRVKMMVIGRDHLASEIGFVSYPDLNYSGDIELIADCLQDLHNSS